MTSDPGQLARAVTAGRHRLRRNRLRRAGWRPAGGRTRRLGGAKLTVLLVSVGATALIAVLGAVRPFERTTPSGETAVADTTWGEQARLAPLDVPQATPEPDPDAEPTTFPQAGDGSFSAADPLDVAGAGSGRDRTFTVEVEGGLEHRPDRVAQVITGVLGDERGWRSDGWSFTHVEGDSDIRILLSSPDTVDRLCAPLMTRGEVSCRAGDFVVLNVKRWTLGVEYYDDLDAYRTYLINHEVGHALGKYHVGCPSPGAEAPVMMQQTYGLQGCVANPWP